MSFLKWFNPLTFIKFTTISFLGAIGLSDVASAVGIGSGLSSIFGGGGGGGASAGTSAGGTIYDPFGTANRQAAGQALMNLMQGKQTWGGAKAKSTTFTSSDPSYQFRYQQGLDALQRTTAAQGVGLSGGALAALENYGQGAASQEFSNEFSRLAAMAGAGSWSGSNLGQLQANQQQMGWGALAQGLGGLSQSNIFGGGSSGYMSGDAFTGMTPNVGINWGGTSTGGMDFTSPSSPWNLSGGTLGGLY